MANGALKSVFLSASIPDPKRDAYYYRTGVVPNIREAVRAVALEVLPRAMLVFGGHPAISPFVRSVAKNLNAEDRVRIYQSKYFEAHIPPEHRTFPDLVWVDEVPGDREQSLAAMRSAMLDDETLVAAVFVGGMEGVEQEYELFCRRHPGKPVYPIPSTGAAALRLFENEAFDAKLAEMLEDDVYDLMFEDLLRPKLVASP